MIATDALSCVPEKYAFSAQLMQAEKAISNQKNDLSIGFPELEIYFDNKGIPEGTLTMLIAKSKVGKTFFVCNSIFYLVSRKIRVLFLSLEMTAAGVIARFSRLIMGIGYAELKDICRESTGLSQLRERFNHFEFPQYLVICDPPCATLKGIETAIGHFNPDVVFLDHLHRVRVENNSDIYSQTTAIAYGLSEIVKRTGKIFISLVQVSRGSEGNKADDGSVMPSMSAGKGSGALEEVADAIIGMCRPEIDPSQAISRRYQIEMRIIGNRYGRSSPNLVYYYDPSSGRLTNENLIHERDPYGQR